MRSINERAVLLGVQQTGTFRFLVIIESVVLMK
jgi:hypothetical protein